MENEDVYKLLEERLEDELGPPENCSWNDIVYCLEGIGVLDYDNLKEILLYGEEEE